MKPFNLKEALSGKPVVTRDGRKIVFLAHDPGALKPYRILVRPENLQCSLLYPESGRWRETVESSFDLLMAKEKKEGWVNVYSNMDTSVVHPTKEDANNAALASRLACCRVEWEE